MTLVARTVPADIHRFLHRAVVLDWMLTAFPFLKPTGSAIDFWPLAIVAPGQRLCADGQALAHRRLRLD